MTLFQIHLSENTQKRNVHEKLTGWTCYFIKIPSRQGSHQSGVKVHRSAQSNSFNSHASTVIKERYDCQPTDHFSATKVAALIFVCSVLVQKVTCAYIPNHIIILESQRTTASFQAIHNSYYTRRIQSIPNYSSFQSFCGDSRTSCGWQSPRAETTQHHSRRSKNNHHNPQLYTQYSLRPTPITASYS